MYLGIDLGTSGVKTILMDTQGKLVASQSAALEVSSPQALWSEQDPNAWWQALTQTMDALSLSQDLSQVKAIGLSGQMHGATLLDEEGEVLRPAILWNDGRSFLECEELQAAVPEAQAITGNLIMPGFTAPKLKWVQKHEPEIFAKIDKVLLPKDYLRYKLCGEFACDLSDAAGTSWLDVGARDWSDEMLSATGLSRAHMPSLFEGSEVTGYLNATLANRWQLKKVPIIAGGGDNAAGAVGVGIVAPNQAMLSLGTSGVYFVVTDGFVSNPKEAMHSFCHALPSRWHCMSVILSAASCLDWVCKLTKYSDVGSMLEALTQSDVKQTDVIFLPYLSGERTPHNNPNAQGVFFGMTHQTSDLDLILAVLEGVGFALAQGVEVVEKAGVSPESISLIGGGSKSAFWRQMLADIIQKPLEYREGGDVGPALGAARLAQLAIETDKTLAQICAAPELVQRHEPDLKKAAAYQVKYAVFKDLYQKIWG